MTENQLLEEISRLIHNEWSEWAQQIKHEVSEERRNRWETVFVDYSELSEEMKEKDREYARKVIEMLKNNHIIK